MHIVLIIHYYWIITGYYWSLLCLTKSSLLQYVYIYMEGGITCGWFKASTEGPGVYTLRIKEETLSKHYEFQPPKAQRTGSGGD